MAGGPIRRGRGRCRSGNVGGGGPASGEEGRGTGKSVRGDALQTSQGFSFSGGSKAAVVVANVVFAAAEVMSTLAKGSICQVLLALIYPVIVKIIVRP